MNLPRPEAEKRYAALDYSSGWMLFDAAPLCLITGTILYLGGAMPCSTDGDEVPQAAVVLDGLIGIAGEA